MENIPDAPDMDKTMPGPGETTEPFIPKPLGDPELMAIIERAENSDEQFKRDATEALRGVFGNQAEVIEIKYLGDRNFGVTVDVGGRAESITIKRAE